MIKVAERLNHIEEYYFSKKLTHTHAYTKCSHKKVSRDYSYFEVHHLFDTLQHIEKSL